MAGCYRASFNFLETAVFRPDGKAAPAQPYRSWGTERIYIVADSSTFISLQHVLVQFFLDDKDAVQGPMVMKHWRQDWRYEPSSLSAYQGNRVWQRRILNDAQRKGVWSQSVFQVDDSPRYASFGRWEHNASFSTWSGSRTLRPPPRREFTVRKDYQALDAVNRHTVVPTGWIRDQDNLKLVLDSAGRPDGRGRPGKPWTPKSPSYWIASFPRPSNARDSNVKWKLVGATWRIQRAGKPGGLIR